MIILYNYNYILTEAMYEAARLPARVGILFHFVDDSDLLI